jgi:hypothetical protein
MNNFSVTKTTTELIGELLVENESSLSLVHAGQSLNVYAIEGENGARRLLINSAIGDDIIIDFN